MIGRISGTLISQQDSHLLIDVHGVGYMVTAPAYVLQSVQINGSLTVFTHLHIREDVMELYGFLTPAELQLFQACISVSGIGPKTAIGIFSTGKKEEIIAAIQRADVDFFIRVPRLGKKNAQKLIIELKNKVGGFVDVDLLGESHADDVQIITALTGMGFSEQEARNAVKAVDAENLTISEKIKSALKTLSTL